MLFLLLCVWLRPPQSPLSSEHILVFQNIPIETDAVDIEVTQKSDQRKITKVASSMQTRLALGNDLYDVEISAPGIARRVFRIDASQIYSQNKPKRHTIRLAKQATCLIRVTDHLHKTVAASLTLVSFALRSGHNRWHARSNEGRFDIQHLPTGKALLRVQSDGFAEAQRELWLDPKSSKITIELQPEAIIHGSVNFEGTPVSKASVLIAGSALWPPRSLSTDNNGSYRITGLAPGVYELRADKDLLVSEAIEGLDINAGEYQSVDFELKPGKKLDVLVRDTKNRPIAFADVRYAENALVIAPRSKKTDWQGQVTIVGLLDTPHYIAVQAPGYLSQTKVVSLDSQEQPISFVLRKAATISGKVINPQGNVVAGAQIQLVGNDTEGLPVWMSGPSTQFQQSIAAQQQHPLALQSRGELGVTLGRVPAIPHAEASISSPQAPSVKPNDDSFATDAHGNFRIAGIAPGRYRVFANADGFAASASREFDVQEQAPQQLIVRLAEAGTIYGTVKDLNGAAVRNIRIQVVTEHEPFFRQAVTGSDGSFRFEALHGNLEVQLIQAAQSAMVRKLFLSPGQELEVPFVLEQHSTEVQGRVVDRYGRGIPQAAIRFAKSQQNAAILQTFSNELGEFALSGLPPAPFDIEIEHSDYAMVRTTVQNPHTPLRILLTGGHKLSGQVFQDGQRIPLPGARIVVEHNNQKRTAYSDESGRFAFDNLYAANYRITVVSPGMVELDDNIVVEREDRKLPPIIMISAGAISGTVVDRLGNPVADAVVQADNADATTQSDAQGNFLLHGLPPGALEVQARHPEAGSANAPNYLRVRAQQTLPGVIIRLPGRLSL